jgi:N-acetylglucosamine malate deacetylase 1
MARPREQPRLITDFSETRVMIVAPHMDDEAIGCGGTIALHVDAGASVTTVFMTDGAGNLPANADPKVRHDEAIAVAGFLGMRSPVFLDGPDTDLGPSDELVGALAGHLGEIAPAIIYVPWFEDVHGDHVATNHVIWHAAERLIDDFADVRVRCYEVWSPLDADIAVDITSTVNRKLLALQLYRSQFIAHDPVPILGLNRFRSMAAGGPATHVECFAEYSWQQYLVEAQPDIH